MKHKKLFAILTLVCFMFTLMPVAAMAEENVAGTASLYIGTSTEVTTTGTLAFVLGAAEEYTGAVTIKLTDGAHTANVKIKGGQDITIVGSKNAVLSGQLATTSSTAGKLTLQGVTYNVDNDIVDSTGISQTGKSAIAIWGNQTVVCEEVTFNMSLANSTAITSWWDTGIGTTIVVKKCQFNCNGQRPIRATGNVTVENCTFNDPYRYAVQLTAKASTATELDKASINFNNNTVVNGENGKAFVYGIQLEGSEYGCNDCVINGVGNTIVNGGTDSTMYYCECGKVEHNSITWNVEVIPVHESCATAHKLTKTAEKEATCTTNGNSAYWTCGVCGRYFSDEAGTTEIAKDSWVIEASHNDTAGWTTDDKQHWKVCAADGCDVIVVAKADHTFGDWTTTKEATTSEKGAKERVCTVCEYKETAEIDKLTPVYSGGGSYVPSTSDKTESTTTTTPSGDTVKVETETKADGTTVETTTTTTATGETTKVEVTTETNDEGTTVETTVTTDAQGETSTTVTATLDNGSAVTNNDAAVEVEVTKVEETVVETVQEAVAADENVEVVGTADNAVSVSATNASTGAAQTSFVQPMAVSVPVDNTVLNNVEDTSKLTLAKVVTNEDGTTELVYMGGSYDKETGTFNAKVNEDGDYILVEKADLVKIELNIGETDIKHNDKATAMEVAPRVNEDNRTMLQLSYIADALGCQTFWDGDTRTVTVVKGDITLTMVIDEVIPGFDTKAVVENGRTLVPAGYISGMLGANVIWDPVDQQVIIVK